MQGKEFVVVQVAYLFAVNWPLRAGSELQRTFLPKLSEKPQERLERSTAGRQREEGFVALRPEQS